MPLRVCFLSLIIGRCAMIVKRHARRARFLDQTAKNVEQGVAWNVLMAARQAGFGGTITTLAVSREPDVQRLLGLPPEFAIAAVVPLGKPRKQLSKLRRRPVAEFVSRERFDGEPFIV